MTTTTAAPTPAVRQTRSVFLGGPFKALVDADGARNTEARTRFETLIERLEAEDYQVYNAHRRESWGAKFLTIGDTESLAEEVIHTVNRLARTGADV